ncbi:hypothetical protein F4778DRAFT_784774 [Xylariomycetidae sp. FL2044]|nr:hypothetical protein F4778DRAFT_784774 [Xylariomycetidae sp. FL2044]
MTLHEVIATRDNLAYRLELLAGIALVERLEKTALVHVQDRHIRTCGSPEQHHYLNARLALLLHLCQTREGAKYVLHANLFRTIEQLGLFTAP